MAYYPFNGNANDESGNGNNGTVNGATLTTDRYGNPNSAYNFDGTNDYIWLGSPNELKMPRFTLSAWIKTNNTKYQNIYRWRLNGQIWDINGLKMNLSFYDSNAKLYSVKSDSIIDEGWHLLVGSYDGSLLKVYQDGSLVASNSNTVPIFYGSGGAAIGRAGDYNDHYFNGKIDDFRLYNRALNETEIQAIYTMNIVDTALPVPTEIVVKTPLTEEDIKNCPLIFNSDNLTLDFPAYNAPVDIYLAIQNPDGELLFIDSTKSLSFEFLPYATGNASQISASFSIASSNLIDELDGKCGIYWLVAPTTGGKLIEAINSNAYELGYYTKDNTSYNNEDIKLILLSDVSTQYNEGNIIDVKWDSINIDPNDDIMIAIKRDMVSGCAEPDNYSWFRFPITKNDGIEAIQLPYNIYEGDDWRIYVKHINSNIYVISDTFSFEHTDDIILDQISPLKSVYYPGELVSLKFSTNTDSGYFWSNYVVSMKRDVVSPCVYSPEEPVDYDWYRFDENNASLDLTSSPQLSLNIRIPEGLHYGNQCCPVRFLHIAFFAL